jgi:hypothetical protein
LTRPHMLHDFMVETAPNLLHQLHRACVEFFDTLACPHHLATNLDLPKFNIESLLFKLETQDRFSPRELPATLFYSLEALPFRPALQSTPAARAQTSFPSAATTTTAASTATRHTHAPATTSPSKPPATPTPTTTSQVTSAIPRTNNFYPTGCRQAITGWKAANNWAATRNLPIDVLAQAAEIPADSIAPLMGLPPNTCQIYLLSGECHSIRCKRQHPHDVTVPQAVTAHITQNLPSIRPQPRPSGPPQSYPART